MLSFGAMKLITLLLLAGIGFTTTACGLSEKRLQRVKDKYVGTPITERIAALGPPENILRISPTEIAYTWSETQAHAAGGTSTYVPNPWLGGGQVYRTPTTVTTSVCRVIFVVHAPNDSLPEYDRRIVDVRAHGDCL